MIKTLVLPLAVGAAALATAGAGVAADGGRPLYASLSGAVEVPGPGDPDGDGSATLRVNPGKGQICYELRVSGIDPAAAAHIHEAEAGVAGPVVVHLSAPSGGFSSGCESVSREFALELISNPEEYYVNVHNAAYPGGAVRGQLSK